MQSHWLISIFFIALSGMFSIPASAATPVKAANLYVPIGYDVNDDVVLVIDGALDSSCFQLTQPQVIVDKEKRTISITPMANFLPNDCIETPVPFEQDVAIGSLDKGEWQVTLASRQTIIETLIIADSSTSGPDNFIYAPIDTVSVKFDSETKRFAAFLKGRMFASCLSWKESQVLDQGKVIVLLPILERSSADCQAIDTPFTERVELPRDIAPGRHLLHVRSLNGRGVNYIFEVHS